MAFTRSQFETACKTYIAKYGAEPPRNEPSLSASPYGWVWKQYPSVPHLGFMARSVLLPSMSSNILEGELEMFPDPDLDTVDDSATSAKFPTVVTTHQHVVFSPTFRVPTFYFSMHRDNGSPLTLADITLSPMLSPCNLDGLEATSFALTSQGSLFPLLSQGEHPVLGTPYWFLHPCHTAEAVEELLNEVKEDHRAEEDRLLRWMETWFMVLGQVVDLRS